MNQKRVRRHYAGAMEMRVKSIYGSTSLFYWICDHVMSRDSMTTFKTVANSVMLLICNEVNSLMFLKKRTKGKTYFSEQNHVKVYNKMIRFTFSSQ